MNRVHRIDKIFLFLPSSESSHQPQNQYFRIVRDLVVDESVERHRSQVFRPPYHAEPHFPNRARGR